MGINLCTSNDKGRRRRRMAGHRKLQATVAFTSTTSIAAPPTLASAAKSNVNKAVSDKYDSDPLVRLVSAAVTHFVDNPPASIGTVDPALKTQIKASAGNMTVDVKPAEDTLLPRAAQAHRPHLVLQL